MQSLKERHDRIHEDAVEEGCGDDGSICARQEGRLREARQRRRR